MQLTIAVPQVVTSSHPFHAAQKAILPVPNTCRGNGVGAQSPMHAAVLAASIESSVHVLGFNALECDLPLDRMLAQ